MIYRFRALRTRSSTRSGPREYTAKGTYDGEEEKGRGGGGGAAPCNGNHLIQHSATWASRYGRRPGTILPSASLCLAACVSLIHYASVRPVCPSPNITDERIYNGTLKARAPTSILRDKVLSDN